MRLIFLTLTAKVRALFLQRFFLLVFRLLLFQRTNYGTKIKIIFELTTILTTLFTKLLTI